MCTNMLGESREVDTSELEYRPSLYGVIIEGANVLLVPHWDGYDFPGGAMIIGETFRETFAREVKEETGLGATIGEHLMTDENFFLHPASKKTFASILMYFTHESIEDGEITDAGFSPAERGFAKKALWVPVEEALTFKFYTPTDAKALIQKALARKK